MKKKIKKKWKSCDIWGFEGTIGEVVAKLLAAENEVLSEYPEATVEICDKSGWDGYAFEIWYERYETESEELNRIAKEEKKAKRDLARQEAKEERERAQYEKLKAKYG